MFYKIFATLLMFSILMICLAQNSTEEPADTANPFIAQLSERLRPVWRFVYSPDGKTLVCGRTNGSIAVYDTQNGQEIAQLRERTLNPPPEFLRILSMVRRLPVEVLTARFISTTQRPQNPSPKSAACGSPGRQQKSVQRTSASGGLRIPPMGACLPRAGRAAMCTSMTQRLGTQRQHNALPNTRNTPLRSQRFAFLPMERRL